MQTTMSEPVVKPGAIVCIGECMMEFRREASNLFACGFGGDTLNTAIYLARLKQNVRYMTALGDDRYSDAMMTAWEYEGIDTSLVARVPGATAGLYIIDTNDVGERSFTYWRDMAAVRRLFGLPEFGRFADVLHSAALIYFSGITLSLFGANDRQALFELLRSCRGKGARVAFDTNFRARAWPDLSLAQTAFGQALDCSDIVIASVEDYSLLFGITSNEHDVERWLRQHNVSEAVVKFDGPCSLVKKNDKVRLVEFPTMTTVVDTTAAGDSFAAAYIVARMAGCDVVESAIAGHRLADIVIRHRGALIPAASTPNSLAALMDNFEPA